MGMLNPTFTPKAGLQVNIHGSITLVPLQPQSPDHTHTSETHTCSALKCQAATRTQAYLPRENTGSDSCVKAPFICELRLGWDTLIPSSFPAFLEASYTKWCL